MFPVKSLPLFLLVLFGPSCVAQSCPADVPTDKDPPPSTLTGTIHHYRQLRDWLGIDLIKPACGEKTIQLIFMKPEPEQRALALDGCSVRLTGSIYESPTGYYSATLSISDPQIEPAPDCHPKPKPPPTQAPPLPAGLRAYSYSIAVDIPQRVPITGRAWRDDGIPGDIEPWSAYADVNLTGGYYIWAGCRKGFVPVAASSSTHDDTDLETGKEAGLSPSEDRVSRFTVKCRRK
jgi:hypothetical protein